MTEATETNIKIVIDRKKNSTSNSSNINQPAILLIGLQGAGKSKLGNMLLGGYTTNPGAEMFEVYNGSYEEDVHRSMGIRTVEIEINNGKYTLVDTPGIVATETYSRRSWDEIIKANVKAMKNHGVQAYILVFAATRLTTTDKTHIEEVIKILGTDRLILVFTKRRKDVTTDREKMESTFNEDLRSILKSINDRWVVAPDLDIFGNDEEGKKVIKRNMDELKRMICEMEVPKRKFIGFKHLKKVAVVLTVLVAAALIVTFVYAKK